MNTVHRSLYCLILLAVQATACGAAPSSEEAAGKSGVSGDTSGSTSGTISGSSGSSTGGSTGVTGTAGTTGTSGGYVLPTAICSTMDCSAITLGTDDPQAGPPAQSIVTILASCGKCFYDAAMTACTAAKTAPNALSSENDTSTSCFMEQVLYDEFDLGPTITSIGDIADAAPGFCLAEFKHITKRRNRQ